MFMFIGIMLIFAVHFIYKVQHFLQNCIVLKIQCGFPKSCIHFKCSYNLKIVIVIY